MECVKFESIKQNLGEKLGRGMQAEIYHHKSDPTKVIKFFHKVKRGSDSLDYIDNVQARTNLEYTISKKAGELGVSPKIYDFAECKKNNVYDAYLVMDKVVGHTVQTFAEVDQYMPKVMHKLRKLREINIDHSDINSGNYMIGTIAGNPTPDIYIIDYGSATIQRKPQDIRLNSITEMSNFLKSQIMRESLLEKTRKDMAKKTNDRICQFNERCQMGKEDEISILREEYDKKPYKTPDIPDNLSQRDKTILSRFNVLNPLFNETDSGPLSYRQKKLYPDYSNIKPRAVLLDHFSKKNRTGGRKKSNRRSYKKRNK